jgi:hypothetical protein
MNSYDDSELQQSTFTDNKPARTGFNILFYFTVILVIFSIGVSIGLVWITMGFDHTDNSKHPDVSTYDPDNREYKSYKEAIMSGLGLCVSTCICLIILAVIFFIYLEGGFLLSEKLSNNLGIAVNAKDHANSFADLLGSLVFREPGQSAQRTEFANNMQDQMMRSYIANYNISPEKEDYYNDLYEDKLDQPLKEEPAPISDFARSRQAFSNDARKVGNVIGKGVNYLSLSERRKRLAYEAQQKALRNDSSIPWNAGGAGNAGGWSYDEDDESEREGPSQGVDEDDRSEREGPLQDVDESGSDNPSWRTTSRTNPFSAQSGEDNDRYSQVNPSTTPKAYRKLNEPAPEEGPFTNQGPYVDI